MLILFAAGRIYRAPPRAAGALRDGRRPLPGDAAASPLDPLVVGAPRGTRYQLLRALRAMARGQAMVVERRIPSLPEHFGNAGAREEWFRSLRDAASWQDDPAIEPILVPGTDFPGAIGRILLRAGWCAPSETPHWVPNLRFFYLTDLGYASFKGAQAWWQELTPLQRTRLMFFE
ncbi:hypothetical protein [Azospira restricta]|uniref:Uncharacterized protein n=1 Tax=Azospira restricta TaxID=404405 RepID=A0A974SQZ6_9RHOO|nr:hypothetical protein [Azospira restricta]QRJ64822.1 hypothetical protein IWH25_05605 [Azospira restricta]